MSTLEFLTVEEVVEINAEQTARHGGLHGIRDLGALESATRAAEFASFYGSEDLYYLAAVYVVHLIQNHPFLDGNKRTGVKAGLVFLALNGVELKRGSGWLRQLEDAAIAVASRQAGVENVASLLRGWLGS